MIKVERKNFIVAAARGAHQAARRYREKMLPSARPHIINDACRRSKDTRRNYSWQHRKRGLRFPLFNRADFKARKSTQTVFARRLKISVAQDK
jgi:hypothetical protein